MELYLQSLIPSWRAQGNFILCRSVCPKCFLLLMCSIQMFVGNSLPPLPVRSTCTANTIIYLITNYKIVVRTLLQNKATDITYYVI
jgi:hypothetical protein